MQIPSDPLLSAYRKKKTEAIKPEIARRCALCAELLLNEAVRREAGSVLLPLEIKAESCGKPYFAGRPYEFNLSHSAHYAACALADYPVGLDLQILTKCDERLISRFFTKREQDFIFSSNNRDAAFTRLWCRKESYLKAIGVGLRLPLDSFEVSDAQAVLIHQEIAYGFRECQAGDLFFCLCAPLLKLPDQLSPECYELP